MKHALEMLHMNWSASCAQKPKNASMLVKPVETFIPEQKNTMKVSECKKKPSYFIRQYQEDVHQDQLREFKAKMTGAFRDCLSRQVREAVMIKRSDRPVLNTKSEWHQPAL